MTRTPLELIDAEREQYYQFNLQNCFSYPWDDPPGGGPLFDLYMATRFTNKLIVALNLDLIEKAALELKSVIPERPGRKIIVIPPTRSEPALITATNPRYPFTYMVYPLGVALAPCTVHFQDVRHDHWKPVKGAVKCQR
jgi:hypothetical protein